jgi:LuxR family maltose regulon positive regulatory protein
VVGMTRLLSLEEQMPEGPIAPGVVKRRTRLSFRSSDVQAGVLSIVSGPIGFGKTTLLRQWASEARYAGERPVWISLTMDDRTVDGLAAAVNRAARATHPSLFATHPGPTDLIAALLTGEHARGTTVILDNWDALLASESAQLIAEILDSGLLSANLVVAGRRQSNLPIDAALERDNLRLIGQSALRLTKFEQRGLMGEALWNAAPTELLNACNGWPLALKLLKSLGQWALPDLAEPAIFASQSGLEAFIKKQLAGASMAGEGEMLSLLGFSSDFDVPLLNRVRNASDSEHLLQGLASLLPFEMHLKQGSLVYRPSELIRPILRKQFDAQPREWQRQISRRAHVESARTGRTLDAINFALLAGKPRRALELIEVVGPFRLMMTYGIEPVQEVLHRLPPELLACSSRSKLALPFAYAKRGQLIEARKMVDAAVQEIEGLNSPRDAGFPARLDAMLVQTQISACSDSGWAGEEKIFRTELVADPIYAAWSMVCTGMASHQLGKLDEADSNFKQARYTFERLGANFQLLHLKLHYAHLDLARGELRRAARSFREIKSCVKAWYPSDGGLFAAAELGRIEVRMLMSESFVQLDRVLRALNNLRQSDGWFEPLASGLTSVCRCIAREHGFDRLIVALDDAESSAHQNGSTHVDGMIQALKAYYLVRAGHHQEASQLLAATQNRHVAFWRERHVRGLALTKSELNEGRPEAALKHAEELARSAREDGRKVALIEALFNRAAVLLEFPSRKREAFASLAEGLSLSEEIFAQGILFEWSALISANKNEVIRLMGSKSALACERLCNDWQGNIGASLLSDKEVAVMKCVAQGGSNKKIARELHVSFNTIKFHLKQCFRKLNAQNRERAVQIATEAGII